MIIWFLQKFLIAAIIIWSSKYLKHWNNVNETLFSETVNYFFPKDLQRHKIKMDLYLCRYSHHMVGGSARVLKLADIMILWYMLH